MFLETLDALMVGKFDASMLDLVRLAICSWSPLELIATCVFFGIVSTFCCTTALEVMAVWFSWPPLEVGVGYLTGNTAFLGMSGNTVGFLGGKDSSVRQFANIVLAASIAANCESHMLVGTSLSAVDKKCMALFILSSTVTRGCVRYSCKYSVVSIMINVLVFLSIA